jgi:hypothetical protein
MNAFEHATGCFKCNLPTAQMQVAQKLLRLLADTSKAVKRMDKERSSE